MPLAGQFVRAGDVPTKTGCRLRRVANQLVSNITDTAISWDTEDDDPLGFITITSPTVTIPAGLDGVYAITAFALSATTLAGRCFIDVVVTTAIVGTPVNLRVTISTVASDLRYLNAVTIPLLAADSFQVHLFHTIGVATNHTAWLSCYRVSPFS